MKVLILVLLTTSFLVQADRVALECVDGSWSKLEKMAVAKQFNVDPNKISTLHAVDVNSNTGTANAYSTFIDGDRKVISKKDLYLNLISRCTDSSAASNSASTSPLPKVQGSDSTAAGILTLFMLAFLTVFGVACTGWGVTGLLRQKCLVTAYKSTLAFMSCNTTDKSTTPFARHLLNIEALAAALLAASKGAKIANEAFNSMVSNSKARYEQAVHATAKPTLEETLLSLPRNEPDFTEEELDEILDPMLQQYKQDVKLLLKTATTRAARIAQMQVTEEMIKTIQKKNQTIDPVLSTAADPANAGGIDISPMGDPLAIDSNVTSNADSAQPSSSTGTNPFVRPIVSPPTLQFAAISVRD